MDPPQDLSDEPFDALDMNGVVQILLAEPDSLDELLPSLPVSLRL